MVDDLFGGSAAPKIPEIKLPPAPGPTDEELAELARQRAGIQSRRKGRGSLRSDLATSVPTPSAGLRIPGPE